jgi:hypothetical protein
MSPTLAAVNAKVPAWLQAAATVFFGGAVGYVEQVVVVGGIPPETDWKRIAIAALGVGAAALLHRYMPTPSSTPTS